MTQQDLIEQFAIEQLLYKYGFSVDNRDVDAYASCFTPDAVVWGVGVELRNDVAGPAIDMLSSMYEATLHCVHNHMHTVQGDRATGMTYCVASHIENRDGQRSKVDMYIRYHDELAKQDGQWRFSKRRLEVVWTTTMPVDPAG